MKLAHTLEILNLVPIKPIDFSHLSSSQREPALQYSNLRLNAIERYIQEEFESTQKYIKIENETLDDVLYGLKNVLQTLTDRMVFNRESYHQILQLRENALKELEKLKNHKPDRNENELKNEIIELKKQIVVLNKQRQDLSDVLILQDFIALNIKNRNFDSLINEIFTWIVMFFYKDPAAVYHWPNFKQEVFINDKGVDFKSRLYKVKAVDLKYEEIERTHHVLKKKEQILADPLILPTQKKSYETLFEIAQIVLQTHEIGVKIHKIEIRLKDLALQSQQAATESQKIEDRINLMKDRIVIQDMIHGQYQRFQEKISSKITSYNEAKRLNNKTLENLQQNPIKVKEIPVVQASTPIQEVVHQPHPVQTQSAYIQVPVETTKWVEVDEQEEFQDSSKIIPAFFVQADENANKLKQPVINDNKQIPPPHLIHIKLQSAYPPQTDVTMGNRQGGCQECHIF